jgi:hypothetical protein
MNSLVPFISASNSWNFIDKARLRKIDIKKDLRIGDADEEAVYQ